MQINYANIPAEMQQYHQWLVWRYEDRNGSKPTKVPYDPRVGNLASVTDPNTWCSFAEAVNAVTSPGTCYDGIGFVLTLNDPYVFFDLDHTADPNELRVQTELFQALDSYSERSPSGKGLHIITKGVSVPQGRRRSNVELYSNERYMTMTGCVFEDKPIQQRDVLIKSIWEQMGGNSRGAYTIETQEQLMSDAEVLDKALGASNGLKFKQILEGSWQGMYPSQSEADIAFIDIVSFYTQNVDQIIRLFYNCPLGQRDKAKRMDYVMGMIHRSFDRMLPPVDINCKREEVENAINNGTLAPAPESAPDQKMFRDSIIEELKSMQLPGKLPKPAGLVGEIADFIYRSSHYPSESIALVGALGLMAGVTGRPYNVSGTGLNLYLLLLAQTGVGKESMSAGISKLLGSITNTMPDKTSVPAAAHFIGPSDFASGQALLRTLSDPNKRCFVSILGEFGLKMQQLAHPRASSSEIMMKKVLLEIYNKSGKGNIMGETGYAKKEDNTNIIESPCVTILAESTPSTFYTAIDEKLITDGLLPRFLFIEQNEKRPYLNENASSVVPSQQLLTSLIDLTTHSLTLQRNNSVVDIKYTEEAREFMRKLERLTTDLINATTNDAMRDLWSRAYVKTAKVAGILAVGQNFYDPIITLNDVLWAYTLVSTDILTIYGRFTRGEIGKNNEEALQGKLVLRTCIDYLTNPWHKIPRYNTSQIMYDEKVIPFSYLQRKLTLMATFRTDLRGSKRALNDALQGLLDAGDLEEIGKGEAFKKYKYKGRGFLIGNPDTLPKDF